MISIRLDCVCSQLSILLITESTERLGNIYEQERKKNSSHRYLPKEYRVVVMHFAKHKSYRVYCKKYGTKKGEEIITLLHDLISSRLQNQEFVFWLDPDTALLTLEKERYRSVCEELELSFSEKIIPFYLPEDLERGYIKAENKHGETKRYPIIELASERIY